MSENSVFYYPYASFTGNQELLLKAVALYFNKLFILDPGKASWDGIGTPKISRDLRLLEDREILVRIRPEEILEKYEKLITESIRADMKDSEFLKLCDQSKRAKYWTLSLAKVPKEIRFDPQYSHLDKPMIRLMGDLSRELLQTPGDYREIEHNFYDEDRETEHGVVEWRYATYPLDLGEAIMINHALYGGLLHTGATPITDDPFHNKVLNLKLQHALQKNPIVRDLLEDRAKIRQLKKANLALRTLTDIDLGIIDPRIPMEEILQFRDKYQKDLQDTRDKIGWLSREIRHKPWTEDFLEEIETDKIPEINKLVQGTKKKYTKWHKDALKALGIVAGAALFGIKLAATTTPLLPIAVGITALTFIKDIALPGTEIAYNWKKGQQEAKNNGLHYLIKFHQLK